MCDEEGSQFLLHAGIVDHRKDESATSRANLYIWKGLNTLLSPEFGDDAGTKLTIACALYGLTSTRASFQNHLANCMQHLGWQSCIVDQDLWMKPETRPNDGYKYYAYCLLYVNGD